MVCQRTPRAVRLSAGVCAAFLCLSFPVHADQPQLRPQLDLRLGHSSVVSAVAVAPDGNIVATGSLDKTIKLWRAASGDLLRTLEGHSGGITALAFSPDGTLLASSSEDKTVKLWRVRGGFLLRTLDGHNAAVRAVTFTPDGKWLVSHGDDGGIRFWNPGTGELQRTLSATAGRAPTPGESAMNALWFSADGKTLACGWMEAGEDASAQLWDVAKGEVKRNFPMEKSAIPAIALAPDGKLLATDTAGTAVQVWDTATGALVKTLTGAKYSLTALAFSPDGQMLAGAGAESFLPNSGAVNQQTLDDVVRLWDIKTGVVVHTLRGHVNWLRAVAFAPNGKTLVSGGADQTARLWDVGTGQTQKMLGGDSAVVSSLACHSRWTGNAGDWLLMGGDRLRLWNLQTGELLKTAENTGIGRTIAAPDGVALAGGAWDGTVGLWNPETTSVLRSWKGHDLTVTALAFAPDGKMLCSAGDDLLVKLWNPTDGRLLHALKGHSKSVGAIAFAPDGSLVASASYDNTVKLWDARTGELRRTLEGHQLPGRALLFSPDGKTLISAGWEESIRLWDVATGTPQRVIELRDHAVLAMLYAPDQETLIVGGPRSDNSGYVGFVNLKTGVMTRELLGHSGLVESLAIGPSRRTLISGGGDHTAKVWDLATGRLLASLYPLLPRKADEGSDYVTVTPEGYYTGSSGADRYISFKIGNDSFPAESFQSIYYRPDLVRKALAGETLPIPRGGGLPVPPAVSFVSYPQQDVTGDSTSVTVQASDDTGIRDVLFFVNGARVGERPTATEAGPLPPEARPLPADSRPLSADSRPLPADARPLPADSRSLSAAAGDLDPKALTADSRPLTADSRDIPTAHKVFRRFKANIPIPRDVANIRVQAVAIDNDGLRSPREEITLHRKDVVQVPGKLLGLCVGISLYQDARLNLKFAEADATALAQTLNQQKGLYSSAQVTALTDDHATREAITTALDKLIAQTTRNDTVMLLLSGHGWRKDERDFYFASYETDRKDVSNSALPWREVVDRLTQLSQKSRRVIVFLDACHSGSAVTNEELVKAVLGANAGVMVFASSRGNEVSLELQDQEHGAFTEALLEAARGQAVPATEKSVTTLNFLAYVSQRVKALTENQQHPQVPYLQDFDTDAALVSKP